MKNKKYIVFTQKEKWFLGKFDPEKSEHAMNAYSRQGGMINACATAIVSGVF